MYRKTKKISRSKKISNTLHSFADFVARNGVVVILSLATAAIPTMAAISVVDGPLNPPYPGLNPDPWNAGATLDFDESSLIIDNGSQVSATTLFMDGRALINSGGSLDAVTTTLLTGAGGAASGAAFHLDAGTVNAGSFSIEPGVVLYIGADNASTFTTAAAGGTGASSTTTISLDSGSQFLATGNTTFGAALSSFSLGPSPTDPAGFAPDLASITALVTAAKGQITDTAMNSINAARGGSGLSGVGNNTLFRVTGDLSLGADTSDALVHINDNSTFDVTGALTGPGASSILNIVSIDSDFDVGGDTNILNGDTGSATLVFYGSDVDLGGGLNSGSASASTLTLSAVDTPIDVVGAIQLRYGSGTAQEFDFTNSPIVSGGDFLAGTLAGVNSAFSFTEIGANLSIGGDMMLSVGGQSVMSGDFRDGVINTTGDFRFSVTGDSSTSVFSASNKDFTTGGSLIFDRVGVTTSSRIDIADAVLSITDDLQFTHTGGGASNTAIQLANVSGAIGRDFNFLTGVTDSINTHVLGGLNLTVGRDVNVTHTETADPGDDDTWFLLSSTLAVSGDITIGSLVTANVANTALTVGGGLDIDGELVPSNFTVTGDASLNAAASLRVEVPTAGTPGVGMTLDGDLSLNSNGTIVLELAGTVPNTMFQPIVHTGPNPVVIDGDLLLEFPDGMSAAALSGQDIPLIESDFPIVGVFQNVMLDAPVPTAGGPSSYILRLNDSGDRLFLQAGARSIPVMGTWGTLLMIALMVGIVARQSNRGGAPLLK